MATPKDPLDALASALCEMIARLESDASAVRNAPNCQEDLKTASDAEKLAASARLLLERAQ